MKKFHFLTSSFYTDSFGGDVIYSKQAVSAINGINLNLLKITPVTLFTLINIFILPFFLIFFPIMWRNILSIKNLYLVSNLRSSLNSYDDVILDHFRVAWVILFLSKKIRFKHISHNLESDVAYKVYRSSFFILKPLYYFEFLKIRFWERAIFSRLYACSYISEDDLKLNPLVVNKTFVIPPYSNKPLTPSFFVGDIKSKVIIIGSFMWSVKRRNLADCLDAFDNCSLPPDFRILIYGKMPQEFSLSIKSRYKFVEVFGVFDNLANLCGKARLAIAPDDVGGGFKLKLLDYYRLGLPIYGITGAMNGFEGITEGVRSFKDYKTLAHFVLKDIECQDSIDTLRNIVFQDRNDLYGKMKINQIWYKFFNI